MGQIFAYSLMSALVLTLMYLVYKWILSGENQHGYNRAVLLGIYSISFAAPPFIPTLSYMLDRGPDEHGTVAVGMPTVEFGTVDSAAPSVLATVLTVVYFSGVFAVVVATCYSALRINNITRKGERYDRDGFTLVVHDDNGLAPFSWRNYIVMNRKDFAESGDLILAHETKHVNARHWVDLMVAQAVAAFQWYNPAAWLMREELKTVHEYQADEAVILSGTDMKQYQMLLIKKAVGGRFQSLANSLNHSNLKKRITMMYKSKSPVGRRLRVLALAPAALVAVAVVNIPAVASALTSASHALDGGKVTKNDGISVTNASETTAAAFGEQSPQKVYEIVQVEPEYPGGINELLKTLGMNLRYPAEAMATNIQGRVVVRFVVTEKGKIASPEVIKSVSPELDAEAIRVLQTLSDFNPGTIDGKPVSVYYTLPITFKLAPDPEKKK
ncbi:MAG TPA: hypothetical protein DCE24_06300 [Porphyromonadaceae bacterium]|nr:M56 family metallopeptidase [Paramuribaculum sp.]HAB41452.1 hypothetical protein [Porphyromonadaceae bacterium]